MSCALTSSYTFVGCGGGAGGIKEVLLVEAANVSSYTQSAGVVTAITMVATKVFRRYVLDKEMGSFSFNMTKSPTGAIVYEPTVDFTIKTLSVATQAELKLIARNQLMMIVKDTNDVYWALGFDKYMELMSATAESGTAFSDFNGNKLSFKGKEVTHAYTVNSGIIAGLL